MFETIINNDMVLRGDKKGGGVSGVKSGRGDWVFIRLWKVYPGFTLYKEV